MSDLYDSQKLPPPFKVEYEVGDSSSPCARCNCHDYHQPHEWLERRTQKLLDDGSVHGKLTARPAAEVLKRASRDRVFGFGFDGWWTTDYSYSGLCGRFRAAIAKPGFSPDGGHDQFRFYAVAVVMPGYAPQPYEHAKRARHQVPEGTPTLFDGLNVIRYMSDDAFSTMLANALQALIDLVNIAEVQV